MIVSWPRYISLMLSEVNKSFLAGAPICGPRVLHGGQGVDTIFVYLNALAVGPWTWHVLFDVDASWVYFKKRLREKRNTTYHSGAQACHGKLPCGLHCPCCENDFRRCQGLVSAWHPHCASTAAGRLFRSACAQCRSCTGLTWWTRCPCPASLSRSQT